MRRLLGDSAVAIFGGLAWLPSIFLGVVIGFAISPDDPTHVGKHWNTAAPYVFWSTAACLALAYGLFAWLLVRRR